MFNLDSQFIFQNGDLRVKHSQSLFFYGWSPVRNNTNDPDVQKFGSPVHMASEPCMLHYDSCRISFVTSVRKTLRICLIFLRAHGNSIVDSLIVSSGKQRPV